MGLAALSGLDLAAQWMELIVLGEKRVICRGFSLHLSRSAQNHVQMNAILDYKPTHMCTG